MCRNWVIRFALTTRCNGGNIKNSTTLSVRSVLMCGATKGYFEPPFMRADSEEG